MDPTPITAETALLNLHSVLAMIHQLKLDLQNTQPAPWTNTIGTEALLLIGDIKSTVDWIDSDVIRTLQQIK